MEKEYRKIIDGVLRTTLQDTIYRTICYYVLKDVNEVRSTIKIEGRHFLTEDERDAVLIQILSSGKNQKHLCDTVEIIRRLQMHDIIAEIMKQYGINHRDADYDHDRITVLFCECCEQIKDIIKMGQYHLLYQQDRPSQGQIQSLVH